MMGAHFNSMGLCKCTHLCENMELCKNEGLCKRSGLCKSRDVSHNMGLCNNMGLSKNGFLCKSRFYVGIRAHERVILNDHWNLVRYFSQFDRCPWPTYWDILVTMNNDPKERRGPKHPCHVRQQQGQVCDLCGCQ